MCGRYTRTTSKEDLIRRFRIQKVETDLFGPRYNVAPSQDCLVVLLREGERVLTSMRWGLVPHWAKDAKLTPINAKAETLAQKPMFRSLLKGKRCLVPANSFFEWKRQPGAKVKQPYRLGMKDWQPFAFAGLWDSRISPEGEELLTFAVITTMPNELVKSIHDRMPVILAEAAEDRWLQEGGTDTLGPIPADDMAAHAVATVVNSPGNDLPACLDPVQV